MTTAGGPALPVVVATGNQPGGPAVPVYGFTAADIADRVVSGGPAQPVYVVSAAEIAAGTYEIEGRPQWMPVYEVADGRASVGGPALPIYVMAGSIGGGPTPSPPIDITGMQLWLEADEIGLSNAAPIATWPGIWGSPDATATGTARPTYRDNIQSYPVARFNGSSNWMQVADSPGLEMNTDSTVYLVCYPTAAADGCYLSKDANAASAGAYLFYIPDPGLDHRLDRPFQDGGSNSSVPQVVNTPSLLTVRVSGTTVQHFTNGVQSGANQTLPVGTQTNQPLRIGAFGNAGISFFITADIAAVLIFNIAHSVAERQAVEAYLMTKYGL